MLKSRWVIGILGILILGFILYFGVSKIHSSIYEDGRLNGITQQQQIYAREQAKLQQDFDIRQAEADKERLALNEKIKELSQNNTQLEKDIARSEALRSQEVSDYAKTNAGRFSCFAPNDNGLFIINKTFPTSSNR